MKILIIVDKMGSAIYKMALAVQKHCPFFNIEVYPVHPKRNSPDDLFMAQDKLKACDVLDIHYWKSGEVLRTSFPVEFAAKPKVLFHFNPYDLDKLNWPDFYQDVVVPNTAMQNKIPYALLVPMGINLGFFKFDPQYTDQKIVHMSVARIESKKGILEVAQACSELNYKLLLIGRVSEVEYLREILTKYGKWVEFRENVDEDTLRLSYYKAAIHVCNSVDNFESGTLPILEAMACGVPVLTRNVGHVPDLYNGENMVIRAGAKDDIEDLKTNLAALMDNLVWRQKISEKAWYTIKNRDERRMAREISGLYYNLWRQGKPVISVIIPTCNRPQIFVETFVAALNQDYKYVEVIVADSSDIPIEPIITRARGQTQVPIKYIHFKKHNYSLAEARNRAIIEAQGEFILFCDDRIIMEPDAASRFMANHAARRWQWGMKNDNEKSFVENFSFVARQDLVTNGMFNERINVYGGMSQDIRHRFETLHNFGFEFNKEAKAISKHKSQSKASRREDIIEAKYILYKLYG